MTAAGAWRKINSMSMPREVHMEQHAVWVWILFAAFPSGAKKCRVFYLHTKMMQVRRARLNYTRDAGPVQS